MSTNVYWLRQSVDDDGHRPDLVTYYDPAGRFKTREGFKEFQSNCCIAAGMDGYPAANWFIPDLYAPQKGATAVEEWDYYMCATFGAFSQRAIDVLTPYFRDHFSLLPARLEGHSYYCLCCRSRLDCLDKTASSIKYFDHDPEKVMMISRHVFRKEILGDSMIFAIPEAGFDLFCTDPIPEIVATARLQGFEFQLVDQGE